MILGIVITILVISIVYFLLEKILNILGWIGEKII